MIIVLDRLCNFCNGWVRFLRKRDRAKRFRFAATQSDYGGGILTELGEPPDDPGTLVLLDGAQRYKKSDAVLRMLSALGGAWRIAGLLRIVPKPLRDACYTAFARRRYRWFGRAQSCPMPDVSRCDRFIG